MNSRPEALFQVLCDEWANLLHAKAIQGELSFG